MNHVLVGAAAPFLVCAVIYAARGFRAGGRLLVLGPLAMLGSGFVAIIPDLPRLWGDYQLYVEWHHRRWAMWAWGHAWFDRPENQRLDSWPGWAVLFVASSALVLAAAWRELRLREAERWRT